MMSLRDAWGIAVGTGRQERKSDAVAGQPLVEWYHRSSDEEARARVLEAMEVLLTEGSPFQEELAANVVSAVPCPSGLANRLVELYASRGWDSDHYLSSFVGGLRDLAPEARETLRRVFMQDPRRQHKLLGAVLEGDEDGVAWREYLGRVRALRQSQELAHAYRDWPRERRREFFDIVCERGEELVRRVARHQLFDRSRRELLAHCGYGDFDPRPVERRRDDGIAVDEVLALLAKQHCSLWFLPSPMQYPDERDRSVFLRRASGSRLAALLRGGRPSQGDRFCDAWYRRDPPQLISMSCWTQEELERRLRGEWRHTGRVPLECVAPFSRVPPFVLKAAPQSIPPAR
jgi:hypothetical protein